MGISFIFSILFVAVNSHRVYTSDTLTRGSSLSVEQSNVVLTSPSGVFSAGFFPVGINAYCFSVWFNDPHLTVVWTANRNIPVNGKASRLILSKSGDLVLTDGGLSIVWTAEKACCRSPAPIELRIRDSGNLVLLSSDEEVLWQSFDSPTDTILPNQPITQYANLVSSRALKNFSSGSYKLFFDTDNVLRLAFDDGVLSSVYWPFPWILTWQAGRSTYNNSKVSVLDSLGNFTSSDEFTFVSSDHGERNVHRRLKLDHDGNVRLYSRIIGSKASEWVVMWQAFSNPCRIHGICGPNSLCLYSPSGRSCSCLEGHKMKNLADWSRGCEPEFELPCRANESRFLEIPNTEFYGYNYGIYYNYTLRECENICSKLCHCKGFQYSFYASDGCFRCFPKMSLNNGYRRPGFSGAVYVRLPKTTADRVSLFRSPQTKNCSSGESPTVFVAREYQKQQESETVRFALWFACGVAGLEIACVASVWGFLVRRRVGPRAEASGFRRFSFRELTKATSGFSREIGRGAGGSVYRAVLSDSRAAAVKRLDEWDQLSGEAEFMAEVNSMGRVNHMNLIEMFGFCADGNHRLLVYEYMDRGSLKDNIFTEKKGLRSEKRFEIAVGTAKGLAYLHEECLEWVLHCDVKPENILLSSEFVPKVADFGLSKLLKRGDEPCFSRIRGTRGYMAPEWVTNKPITSKVDVYSYGVVLLEMLTGKQHGSCERGVVNWVKERLNACGGDVATTLEKIIDESIGGKYDEGRMGVLLRVALYCVEEEWDQRPTMRQVVEMFQYH